MTIRTLLAAASQFKPTGSIPGSDELLFGDFQSRGFYGEVDASDLIGGMALSELCDLSSIGVLMEDNPTWLKFSRFGKILFIPKVPLRHSITIDQYRDRDLVYGRTVVIRGHRYLVRFMTGGNANPATDSGGEWNDLMYPISVGRPANQPIWANYSQSSLKVTDGGLGSATFCQEVRSGQTFHIYRGYTGIRTFSQAHANSTMNHYGWRPVLEYIGPI